MDYCVSRGGGGRGPGPREWGPRGSLTVHGGPGAPGLAPAGAVGPTRQPHPRARAADGRAPRGSRSARPKAATSAWPAGGGAPAPLWSPAAAIGAAERRPREGRERGKRGGGPRLTLGRRRRRKRRPERRKAAARLGRTGTAALWRSASSTRGWTVTAAVRRSRRRRRWGGKRSRRAERAGRRSSATEEREGDGASSIPARRRCGKRVETGEGGAGRV
ncbi:RNA binding protein -like [Oryza sativa Japonica Group]|uniref:RNA binding protein-like n=1 Tax=Oryza sativa subsp. japonica TaxID=39947 RepID=Q5QM21_ORYSJ|nr:RNA binding protein -like [Oryza sativa Japonica Group]